MLYKFKSKACGDVIMLQAHGQRMLEIIGKYRPDDPGAAGILLPEQMTKALRDLEDAIDEEDHAREQALAQASSQGLPPPRFEGPALRHRALPLKNKIGRAHV